MPELPEVESVRQSLAAVVLKDTIEAVDVYLPKMVKTHAVNDFKKTLKDQTIKAVHRRGKHLIVELSDHLLMVHLRMEGKFFITPTPQEKNKHEHLRFYLKSGRVLTYEDVRTFGTFHLYDKVAFTTLPPLLKAGLEPFDEGFNGTYLKAQFKLRKSPIKAALLDQTVLLGLGNIYADEVLFKAKVHPLTKASKITLKKAQALAEASQLILAEAVKAGGTMIRTYHNSLGIDGLFQQQLKVHTKEHEPCETCQSLIQRIKVSGRSTYYCPTCQMR
jgi:formamidopyrimidine-DNA glycosylase